MQKFSDEPLSVHEDCGGHVERLLSAPALQFKGTGWYVTDYARKGAGTNGKSEGKTGTESTAAKSAKTDGASSAGKDSTASKT
jgi:predicted nucleic acid-binding Zn ribbon protein